MARDNILLAYVAADILFVAAGGLLIIFALMIESETGNAPTVKTVSRKLLLLVCPAKCMFPYWFSSMVNCGFITDMKYSRYCECRSHLPRLLGFRPCNGNPIYTRLVEATWIHGDNLCVVHHGSWFNYLVRDAEDEKQSISSLGQSTTFYTKSVTTRGTFHDTRSERRDM